MNPYRRIMACGLCRNELRGNIRERVHRMPAMKQPGKPDTGNPFVRFDEERSGNAEPTTTVSSIRPLPLRLLYRMTLAERFGFTSTCFRERLTKPIDGHGFGFCRDVTVRKL